MSYYRFPVEPLFTHSLVDSPPDLGECPAELDASRKCDYYPSDAGDNPGHPVFVPREDIARICYPDYADSEQDHAYRLPTTDRTEHSRRFGGQRIARKATSGTLSVTGRCRSKTAVIPGSLSAVSLCPHRQSRTTNEDGLQMKWWIGADTLAPHIPSLRQ